MSASSPVNAGIRRRGRSFFGFLRVLLILILLILLAAAGFVYYSVQRVMPTINGSVQAVGLAQNVTVIRDKDGIPHLYAATPSDLFFANGYVHAQDRMFQMELFRRNASGRLSEFAGERALRLDKLMRTIGLRRVAEQELATLTLEQREPLDRYAAGVNAFLEANKDKLPIEFTLAGIRPDPWTAVDSLAIGRQIPWTLSENWRDELLTADLAAKLGPDRALDLFPDVDSSFNTVAGSGNTNGQLTRDQLAAAAQYGNPRGSLRDYDEIASNPLMMKMEGLGSNNWVVGGDKSATGKPLLANDPHLGVQNPSIWTQLHLQTTDGSYNVVGFSFAGIPGVVIGHNERIAWGVTNVGPDTQDIFVEKVDAAHPGQYEFAGSWQDFETVSETIKIKGLPDQIFPVRYTRHGPIISDAISGTTRTFALRWVANEPIGLLPSVLELDRAVDWNSFRTALSKWNLAGQNFVYADMEGNIGYQSTGRVPTRIQGNGMAPVDGSSGEFEWTGYVSFEEMPSQFNPPSKFIATANNRPAASPFLGARFASPYRVVRIRQLLTEKPTLSATDLAAIQNDTVDLFSQKLAKFLAPLKSNDPIVQRAIDRFNGWNGDMAADSPTAALSGQVLQRLLEYTFKDELGKDLYEDYVDSNFVETKIDGMLDRQADLWWDDTTTSGTQEQRDDILLKAITAAVTDLQSSQGSDQSQWQWGKLHKLALDHPLGTFEAAGIRIFGSFNHGPFNRPGNNTTVNVSHYSFAEPYEETSYPSMRKIDDLSDWAKSQWIVPGGASGQPFNKHFGDQVDRYIKGEYIPMRFDDASIKDGADGTLTLTP